MTRSQRVKMTSIRAITFTAGQKTSYRRTSSVPQLTCQGKECRNYQPDVVQCTAVGEDGAGGLEWSCTADLPKNVRFGSVEVGCEGWEGPDDPYVLRGSCGLTYNLVRTSPALEDGRFSSFRRQSQTPLIDSLFTYAFFGVSVYILYRLLSSIFARRPAVADRNNRAGGGGRGVGWWPGGGGGWWPGGGGGGGGGGGSFGRGGPPPPPYSAKPDASSSTSTSGWSPGFWSGIAAGALGTAAMNANRGHGGGLGLGGRSSRYAEQSAFERYRDDMDRGVGGSGSWGRGSGRAGAGGSMFGGGGSSSSGTGSSSMRSSTGFGGTRNR